MSTKLIYESRDCHVEVEVPHDDMAMDDLIDQLVVPTLRGAGYAEETIKSVLIADV